jgi:hypothetical protein
MKFLLIRKPRMGTGMTPTSDMVRAHKETVLGALNVVKPTVSTPSWVAAAAPF